MQDGNETKDVTQMSDAELDAKARELVNDSETDPGTEKQPDNLKQDSHEEKPAKEPDNADGKTGEETEGSEGGELYAGVFKTSDDLTKSVTGLASKLNITGFAERALNKEIDAAKKSGDWTEVEETYKSLQADFTKSKQGKPDAGTETGQATQTEPEATPAEEVEATSKLNTWIANETAEQLLVHPIAKEFRDAGIRFPESQEDLKALRELDPVLYMEYRDTVMQIGRDLGSFVENHLKTDQAREGKITEARTEGETFIAQMNEKFKLGLTKEQIAAEIDKALKSDEAYTDEYGVKIPRKDGIRKYFLQESMPNLIPVIQANAAKAGAETHRKDVKKMTDAIVETASTSGKVATSRKPGKIDLANPDHVRGLSDRDLDANLKSLVDKDE